MTNRYIFLSMLLSLSLLAVAAGTYWLSMRINPDIYQTDSAQKLYDKVSRDELEVTKDKWLAYLASNIESQKSTRNLISNNNGAMESLAELLATIGAIQGTLLIAIYRRVRKSA